MSILSENIRYLRGKLNLSQQRVADDLLITRGRYGKYEDGATEPPLDILVRISKYYNVSIDLLLTINVSKYSIDEIMELPDNRIVLPIRVDSNGNDEIEIIPQKASMGYLNGYGDPEYIESLDTISLPFLKAGSLELFRLKEILCHHIKTEPILWENILRIFLTFEQTEHMFLLLPMMV